MEIETAYALVSFLTCLLCVIPLSYAIYMVFKVRRIEQSDIDSVSKTNKLENKEVIGQVTLEDIQETNSILIYEVAKESDNHVTINTQGLGIAFIGIGAIIASVILFKAIEKWVEFKRYKLMKYEEIMSKPLDTFGNSSIRELENKYK